MLGLPRHFLLSFVIFICLYLIRFRQFAVINLNEIKPNQYIRVYAEIEDIPKIKNSLQVFKVGQIWIKTKSKEQFSFRERVKVVGKPQVRVINRFYKQIWLIDPKISKFDILSKNEQECFSPRRFFSLDWGKEIIILLDFIRRKTRNVYYRILPEPQGSLLAGIVLGLQGSMDWDFWQALKRTSTLHIVAASGMNVTLIAKVVIDFLIQFINRRRAYFLSVVAILIYCLLAGASSPVIRAGLMASFAFLGLAFGRETWPGWLLFLAGSLMLLVNPFLIFDTGFQLSFAAMAGMIFLRPVLTKIFTLAYHNLDIAFRIKLAKNLVPINDGFRRSHCKSSPNWISSLFFSNFQDTLSAQIATFPILYFTFGQFQPLAFLPNLFVLPLVPTLMVLGFIILVCGLIWLPLASPVAWLTWLPLTYFVEVIKWWGRLLN